MMKPSSKLSSSKAPVTSRFVGWLDKRRLSEPTTVMLTALLVGIGAGFGAVIFRALISGFQSVAYQGLGNLLVGIRPFHLLLIPALGGAIFGPLIYFFAKEAKGHGVPEVMEAVALHGGRIRPRVAVIKSLASAICIGVGGSIGREGPIAQIGSAIGSTVGQWFHLSDERVRNLVACGAAGGIAATFNAPIAGSLFALEVILGQLHTTYFGAVVISAVAADVVAQVFEGNARSFAVPEYALVSPWEFLLYILLGIMGALVAVVFTRSLYLSEDLWDSLPFPEYFKPVLGGLVLGVLGILAAKRVGFPRIFGVGYDSISEALFGGFAIQVTISLLVFKLLATIVTLGSGGSGGIFAPSLFMGAMLGDAFGKVVNLLFPGFTAPPGAYALVGMSAVFSGAAHAPATAILIMFEMTGDYRIILPLMLATVMSTLISRAISHESIYTLKLTRRGIHLEQGQDIDLMQTVTVGEVMSREVDTVSPQMLLTDLVDEFARTHHHGFPVVNGDHELIGIVSIQDMERAIAGGSIEGKTVAQIGTLDNLLLAYPQESVGEALRRLAIRDVSRLPVVESRDSLKLVGVIRRGDIIRAYNTAVVKRSHRQQRAETLRLGKLDNTDFIEVEIPAEAKVVGKALHEIDLPEDCLVVSVRRGRKLHVAHGRTRLREKDKLTVFVRQEHSAEVRHSLTMPSPEKDEDAHAETKS